MQLSVFSLLLPLLLSLWTTNAGADDAVPTAVNQALAGIIPGQQPDSVARTPVSGIYEAVYGPQVVYITADGQYIFNGDLYALGTRTNLTEAKRKQGRLQLLNSIDPATFITFKPEKIKYVVTVFTDVDCTYCRKMHSEINTYLNRGIEIRYASYPRTGANTSSYDKAVSVWCAPDRQAALTRAKTGAQPVKRSCENPVDEHMAIAEELGINGTPLLVFADGSMVPGYMDATQMQQYLESIKPKQ